MSGEGEGGIVNFLHGGRKFSGTTQFMFLSCSAGSSGTYLAEIIKKKYVYLEEACLPQAEVIKEIEQAVGHKVTKVQVFDALQRLGNIWKNTIRIGNRKDGTDNRQRMYLFSIIYSSYCTVQHIVIVFIILLS